MMVRCPANDSAQVNRVDAAATSAAGAGDSGLATVAAIDRAAK
jgi:hypothetical protein